MRVGLLLWYKQFIACGLFLSRKESGRAGLRERVGETERERERESGRETAREL